MLYPTDLSEEERQAGFSIRSVNDPHGHYRDALSLHQALVPPKLIPAVVCYVGPSDRVIKKQSADGTINYRGQRYGKATVGESDAKWRTIAEVRSLSPSDAVAKASTWLGKEVHPKIITLPQGEN